MSQETPRRLLSGLLIVLLHTPLIAYAYWLYPQLPPGESILQLPFLQLLILLALLVLPYAVLGRIATGWNPDRARLGEYEQ